LGSILGLEILSAEEREDSMKKAIAVVFLIALAGSTPRLHAKEASENRGASMLFAAPQDRQLQRLEQLAARVAKLEDEITRLEERNKQLRAQLASNAPLGMPGGVPGLPVAGPGGAIENRGK
jgi:hypothetical protein